MQPGTRSWCLLVDPAHRRPQAPTAVKTKEQQSHSWSAWRGEWNTGEVPWDSPQKPSPSPALVLLPTQHTSKVAAEPSTPVAMQLQEVCSWELGSCQAAGLSRWLKGITCILKEKVLYSTGLLHDNPHASELPKGDWKLSQLTGIWSSCSRSPRTQSSERALTIALWCCMRLWGWWISRHLSEEGSSRSLHSQPSSPVTELRKKDL